MVVFIVEERDIICNYQFCMHIMYMNLMISHYADLYTLI